MATMDHGHHHHGHASDTATDPVCGMKVTIATATNKAEHAGHTYYFCSQRCLAKFTAEPQRYLAAETGRSDAEAGTIYTCPMHPEIRQEGPGAARSAAWRWSRWRRRSTRAPTRSSWT